MSRAHHRVAVDDGEDLIRRAIADVLERAEHDEVYRLRSPLVRRCADAHLAHRTRFHPVPRCESCGAFGALPPLTAGIGFCASCWDVSLDAVDDPYRDTGVGD